MQMTTLIAVLLTLAAAAFVVGYALSRKTGRRAGGLRHLNSLPSYYGGLALLWTLVPALLLMLLWLSVQNSVIHQRVLAQLPPSYQQASEGELSLVLNTVQNEAASDAIADDLALQPAVDMLSNLQQASRTTLAAFVILLAVSGLLVTALRIRTTLKARKEVERFIYFGLMASSMVAILATIGIVFSVLFETLRFFKSVNVFSFLFGLNWSPQMSIRADQIGSSGSFGAVPLFTGTLLISGIAMLIAVPVGLMSAIYLSEYAHRRVRDTLKPVLEILAGIPTVVYGFFAALTVGPLVRQIGEHYGLVVASESALAAGLVMGIMIIPFVSSLADDVITAVPQSMRDGSFALGATHSETIRLVIIPAALPGIVGGVLLAVSRAIGETMIVVMAAGMAAKLTANPLEAVTTVTVQIVSLLVGDQEFDSPKTLAAFALGLVLFTVTLSLNFIALVVVKKYREQYE